MATQTITSEFRFEAAHRLLNYDGKCKYLHGHSYRAQLTVSAPGLDDRGMILDFGDLKKITKNWIDTNWDHNIILNLNDPLVKLAGTRWDQGIEMSKWVDDVFAGKGPYTIEGNPTAENLARVLCHVITPKLPSHTSLVRVTVFETPTCCSDYIP